MLKLAIRLRQWGWEGAADFLLALESALAKLGRADRIIRKERARRQKHPPVSPSIVMGG